MKKRFCLLIALLLSLCLGLSCAAEQIFESTPFALEAEEQLELIDQYQLVPSVVLAEEARLNVLEDAELVLGEESTDEKTILDTGAVLTLEDRAVINVYGDLYGWIADIVMGEDSEINIFLSAGARMAALLPEELVEPEKLEELENSFTYYGLNIIGLDNPDSIAVVDSDGNSIVFGHGDKTDSIVHPGERYTVQFKTGLNKGRRLSFVLDPSRPLNLAELLAQNPLTAKLSLEAADVTEADAEIPFTATLSRAARRSASVTLRVGEVDYTIDIPAGATSGNVLVANPNGEDPYLDAGTLTATVTGFSGGGFDRVYDRDVSATVNISDTIDTTTVSLSATDGKEGDDTVAFTVSLSNPVQTAATATVNANDKSYTVTIPAGASSANLSVPNPNTEDVYLDASTLTASVTAFEGGDFEAVDFSKASATANIADTVDTTAVTLSATDGKEGDDTVAFTVSLSNPAQTAATTTVNANDKSYTVTIPAGKSSATVSVPNPNAEDVYLDASTLTGTVTAFEGGDFEAVDFSKASATANIADTVDTTTVSLSATDGKEGDETISFTVSLSNPAQTAATATVYVGGTDCAVTIPAGASSANLSVPNPNTEDVYLDASTLTASVTAFEGGDFEAVDFSKASATANIADTVDTTTVSLSATDGKEGDANISFTVTLDNAARTAATATVNANSKSYTVTIPAGKSSATVSVPNPYTNDPYIGARTLTGTVTAFEGGDFEAVDFSKASATANIADIIDTTTVSLSAPSVIDRNAENVVFTITLSKPAQTAATATVNVGGTNYTVNIAANATSGSLSVPINGASSLTGTFVGLTGGNFEKLDVSGASTTVRICDPVIVSLSATDGKEGDETIRFTVTLSAPAQTAATATVRVGETDYTVTIAAGYTSGSINVPNSNGEDFYIDETRLTGKVTGFSGGFDLVSYSGATATARITDTIDITRVSLSASDYLETDAYTTFTVRLSNPAQTDATVTLNVGGTDYAFYIAAGTTSDSVSVPINGASSLTGTVTGLSGGNFEALDYRETTATARCIVFAP